MNPRRGDGRKCFKATPGGAPEIGLSVPEILRSDERVEPHAGLREEHPAPLLAIDHAAAFFHDRAVALRTMAYGLPLAKLTAAAIGTAPSSTPAIRSASRA